jgi:hypothetical protein
MFMKSLHVERNRHVRFTNCGARVFTRKFNVGLTTASILLMIVCPLFSAGFAATYYIDYQNGSDLNSGILKTSAWKLCPGMRGYSGNYSHSPGDKFVFKGGAVWPSTAFPLEVTYSGSAGLVDEYTVDASWYSGTSWARPVFDAAGKSYFKIDNIEIRNVNYPNVQNGYKAIQLETCDNIEISYLRLRPYAWIGLYIYTTSPKSNYKIHHNDISDCAMGMVIATSEANATIDNVEIYNNDFHDFNSMLVGSSHGDGIHTWTSPGADSSQYISNMKIYNNKFYGNWTPQPPSTGTTGFIYLEDGNKSAMIYNNVMYYDGVPTTQNWFQAPITIAGNSSTAGNGQHKIYNNTIRGTDPGMSACLYVISSDYVDVKNNIFSGCKYAYDFEIGTSNSSVDYNDVYSNDTDYVGKWNGALRSWVAWRSVGHDAHSIRANPKFISTSNLGIQSTSPCVGVGIDLSSYFITDIIGRPRTSPWDAGAYNHPARDVQPPTNLHVVQQ